MLADLLRCGPEVLGSALIAAGLMWWFRRDASPLPAVVCFALAGLARETLLLVPLVLFAAEWWSVRRLTGSRPTERPLVEGPTGARQGLQWCLLGAVVPYVTWVTMLRVGLGAWPEGSVGGRLSIVPFAGLVEAAGSWRRDEVLVAALVLLPAIAALVLPGDNRLRILVGAHLLLAAGLGAPVWMRYLDFSRVLLPLGLVSLLAIASGHRRPATTTAPQVGGETDAVDYLVVG